MFGPSWIYIAYRSMQPRYFHVVLLYICHPSRLSKHEGLETALSEHETEGVRLTRLLKVCFSRKVCRYLYCGFQRYLYTYRRKNLLVRATCRFYEMPQAFGIVHSHSVSIFPPNFPIPHASHTDCNGETAASGALLECPADQIG